MSKILYELKKLISSKLFILATVIMLGMLVYVMFFCQDLSKEAADAERTANYINTEIPDDITPEYLLKLKEKSDEDFNYILQNMTEAENPELEEFSLNHYAEAEALSQMLYSGTFAKHRVEYITNAQKQYSAAEQSGNDADMRYYKLMTDEYNRVTDISLIASGAAEKYFYSALPTMYPFYLFGLIFTMWAMLITSYLLCCERQSKTDLTAYSTKGGRAGMYLNKMAAVGITVTAAVGLIFAVKYALGVVVFKIDWFASIQSYIGFEESTYGLNMLGLLIITQLMLLGSAMTGVFLASLFSIRASYPIRGVLLSLVTVFAIYRIYIFIRATGTPTETVRAFNDIRVFVPLFMQFPENYFTGFDYISILGFPISRLAMSFIMVGIIGIVSLTICAKLYGRRSDFNWKAKLSNLKKSRNNTAA